MMARAKLTLGGAPIVLGGTALAATLAVLSWRRRRASKACDGKRRVVVLGAGYCGGAIARHMSQEEACDVIGTSRNDADPANARAGVRTVIVGGGRAPEAAKGGRAKTAAEEVAASLLLADVIVATAPPGEAGDPFLADSLLRPALESAASRGALIIYLSSVGVYGNQDGNLVTEETSPAPRTARAKKRLAAEEMWRALPVQRLAIVRLPGIYGPFRGPLAKAGEGNMLVVKEGHLFSRIHVDDVVNLCVKLMGTVCDNEPSGLWEKGVSIINCCDSEPAPQHEVSALAYTLLGRTIPVPVPFEKAELSAMQRSFYEESRRMDNAKLLRLVGSLKYPSFRTGLPACVEQERLSAARSTRSFLSRILALRRLPRAVATRSASLLQKVVLSRAPVMRVALIDNGSLKPEATFSLRRLATALESAASVRGLRLRVDAVAARFADRIPAQDLDGKPAEILAGWLQRVAGEEGERSKILLLPLLIGPSATITKSIPAAARAVKGLGEVSVAPCLVCLCPAIIEPGMSGANEVAGMLADNLKASAAADWCGQNDFLFICDHGSPVARVAAARDAVRIELEKQLKRSIQGCCMERREGPDFDFNGELLQDALLALPDGARAAVLLLFLQAGRHAGPGGDLETIVAGVLEKRPDLSVVMTPVLAGHNALIDLLLRRIEKPVPLALFA